jgi:hypothetical protein
VGSCACMGVIVGSSMTTGSNGPTEVVSGRVSSLGFSVSSTGCFS